MAQPRDTYFFLRRRLRDLDALTSAFEGNPWSARDDGGEERSSNAGDRIVSYRDRVEFWQRGATRPTKEFFR